MPAPAASEETVVRELTHEGTLLGTLQHISPEQLQGREADARTDIFAFGLVLYEMRAGTTWSSWAPGVLSSDFSQWVALVNNPRRPLDSTGSASPTSLLALLRPKAPAVRGQALAGVACMRRRKKYESPQRTLVTAAQPHASGPSPTERWAMSAEARVMAKPA